MWQTITDDPTVLGYVEGYSIPFILCPVTQPYVEIDNINSELKKLIRSYN